MNIKQIRQEIAVRLEDYVDIKQTERIMWGKKWTWVTYYCKFCDVSYNAPTCNDWEAVESIKHHIIMNHKYLFMKDLVKPWEDENSLFCSPKLKEIIGKEPLTGDECGTA